MINAINSVRSFYTPNFTGNKYRKAVQYFDDCFCPSDSGRIVKNVFNYSAEVGSVPVRPYMGSMDKMAGCSTEGTELGGGWLKADIDTPLSTTGVQTCAVLNLVNKDTLEQVLYHVFHKTSSSRIEQFIREIFPSFTHVNIVGGQQFQTVNTMRKVVDAVDNVNPRALKTYYHTLCDNPQLVACNGEIYHIKGKSGEVSFVQNTENYWY